MQIFFSHFIADIYKKNKNKKKTFKLLCVKTNKLKRIIYDLYRVRVMVFNTTFNNISVISWQSVLLVEETGGPGENHQSAASH